MTLPLQQDPQLAAAFGLINTGLLQIANGLAQIAAGQHANAAAAGTGNAQILQGNADVQQGLAQFLVGLAAALQRLQELMADDTDSSDTDDDSDDGGGSGGGHLGARFGFSMADLDAAASGLNNLGDGMQADGGALGGMVAPNN